MKKTAFCAAEQKDTAHSFAFEVAGQNREIIARCDSCGSMFKIPGDATKDQIGAHLAKYKSANQGQVAAAAPGAAEAQRKHLESLLG